MNAILGVLLIATLAIVAIASVAIVIRHNAARAKWAADFWMAGRERSS
jgi:hypothetical protein